MKYDEYKEKCIEYIKVHINPIKKDHILDFCKSIQCFICFDAEILWNARSFVSTFDLQGKYEIVNCHHCGNGKVSSYSNTNRFKKNRLNVFPFPSGSFETIVYELQQIPLPAEEEVDESIPLWYLCTDETISRNIHKKTATVDISQLSLDIANIVQIHLGNLIQIPNFIASLNCKFSYSNSKEHSTNHWYEQIHDTDKTPIYLMFKLYKEFIQTKMEFGLCRCVGNSSNQYYYVRITIMKPKNKLAQKECDELVNAKMKRIILSKRRQPDEED